MFTLCSILKKNIHFFVCVFLLSERWDGEISEGGRGEDAKGNHSLLFPRGNQLGSTDRISQVKLLVVSL